MADTLLIHYTPAQPQQVVWSVANGNNELTAKLSYGSLSEAATLAEGKRVVILFDSNFIHLDELELPTKNKQKLLNAVPFALEEDLADDIDDMHFVIANTDHGSTAVACIDKRHLDTLLDLCRDAKLSVDAVIPDALCLSGDKNQWALLLSDDNAYLQRGDLVSTCIQRDCYGDLLKHLLADEESTTPEKLLIFQAQGEETEQPQDDSLAQTEVIAVAFNEHPIVIFCENYRHAMGLNLLQHDYKPVSKGGTQLLRWRLAASLALLWLVVHLAGIGLQSAELESANQQLNARIIETYKTSFPESKRIVNARVQMEQKLKELQSGSSGNDTDLLSLLSQVHPAFTANKDVSIQSIAYRNQVVDITVTSKNLKSVEAINARLNKDALKSEIVSSTSEKDTVKGSIRVRRPNS